LDQVRLDGIPALDEPVPSVPPTEFYTTFDRGNKFFELTNHLGNVLVTVTDKRIPVGGAVGSTITGWQADVATANDYYPFGMQMPGRNGRAVQGGWASGTTVINGVSVPTDLVVSDCSGNTPAVYEAANSVTFIPNFNSGGNDQFDVIIATAQNTSPGSTGTLGTGGGTNGTSAYRYGFNGQEHSTELEGDDYTAAFWEYDSRIGRRWNLDPKPNVGISQYSAFSNNPILLDDPNGDTIRGATKGDAKILKDDIKASLPGDHFKNVRDLIKVDKDKKSLATISDDNLSKALNGVKLTPDEQALLDGIVNTINSTDVHSVTFLNTTDMIPEAWIEGFKREGGDPNNAVTKRLAAVFSNNMNVSDIPLGQLPAGYLKNFGGGATVSDGACGSFSAILYDPQIQEKHSGYFNSKDNTPVSSPNMRPTIHEIFHGRLMSLGIANQQVPIIQLENLQLRVMNLHTYRDGSNHNVKEGEPQILTEQERNTIPEFLKRK
jgi:hypothetical protein